VEEQPKKKRRGGLEFIPLREGHSETDYEVPRGRRHPGQLEFVPPAPKVRKKRGK